MSNLALTCPIPECCQPVIVRSKKPDGHRLICPCKWQTVLELTHTPHLHLVHIPLKERKP